jgi:hypothetical protein
MPHSHNIVILYSQKYLEKAVLWTYLNHTEFQYVNTVSKVNASTRDADTALH